MGIPGTPYLILIFLKPLLSIKGDRFIFLAVTERFEDKSKRDTMARPLRIEYDGASTTSPPPGERQKSIFQDEEDRVFFFDILYKINQRHHWLCHAYCLMNNHYHLVIETPNGDLSKGMRQWVCSHSGRQGRVLIYSAEGFGAGGGGGASFLADSPEGAGLLSPFSFVSEAG